MSGALDEGIYNIQIGSGSTFKNLCANSAGQGVACNPHDVTQLWHLNANQGVFESWKAPFMKSKTSIYVDPATGQASFPVKSCDPMEDTGACTVTPPFSTPSAGYFPVQSQQITAIKTTIGGKEQCLDPSDWKAKDCATPYLNFVPVNPTTASPYNPQNLNRAIQGLTIPITCHFPGGTNPSIGHNTNFIQNCCNGYNSVPDVSKMTNYAFPNNRTYVQDQVYVQVNQSGKSVTGTNNTQIPLFYLTNVLVVEGSTIETPVTLQDASGNRITFYYAVLHFQQGGLNLYAILQTNNTYDPFTTQIPNGGTTQVDLLQLLNVPGNPPVSQQDLLSAQIIDIHYMTDGSIPYVMNPELCDPTWCPFSAYCTSQYPQEMVTYCAQIAANGLPMIKVDPNCKIWYDDITMGSGSASSQAVDQFCTNFPNHPSCRCVNGEQTTTYQRMLNLFQQLGGATASVPPPPCWSSMCTLDRPDVDGPLWDLNDYNPKCPPLNLTFCQQIIDAAGNTVNIEKNTFIQNCSASTPGPPPPPSPSPTPSSTHETVFNEGSVSCNTYCGTNWNNEMTSLGWTGATCQSAKNMSTLQSTTCDATLSNAGPTTFLQCVCAQNTTTPFQPMPYPNMYTTKNNDGTRSCNDYCAQGANGELPKAWTGATGISARVKSSLATIDSKTVANEPVWCLCGQSTTPFSPAPSPSPPVPTPPSPQPPGPPPSPQSPGVWDELVSKYGAGAVIGGGIGLFVVVGFILYFALK